MEYRNTAAAHTLANQHCARQGARALNLEAVDLGCERLQLYAIRPQQPHDHQGRRDKRGDACESRTCLQAAEKTNTQANASPVTTAKTRNERRASVRPSQVDVNGVRKKEKSKAIFSSPTLTSKTFPFRFVSPLQFLKTVKLEMTYV